MESKRIINGIFAELLVASICYPLNTLKIRKQLNLPFQSYNSLYRGIGFCLLNEFVDSLIFFSVFEKINKSVTIGSSVGSIVSNSISYPLYLRTRLRQSGNTMGVTYNYRGFISSLACSLPSTTLNYTIKDRLNKKINPKYKKVSGYFAAALSLFITQPINNFAVYKQTNLPYKLLDIFNYRSFGIRLIEQTIQVGSKMYIMDHLNSNIKL